MPGASAAGGGRNSAASTMSDGRWRRHKGAPPSCSAKCRSICAASVASAVNTLWSPATCM